jgi:hypothetical protein
MTVVGTGALRGEGHEATCTVRALKVSLPNEPDEFEYVRFSVVDVSTKIPEGTYRISAFGWTYSMQYRNGRWLSMP